MQIFRCPICGAGLNGFFPQSCLCGSIYIFEVFVMENNFAKMDLEETIFFYTRNDYLIINNLLFGNMNHLWEVAEIVNGDSKGMLKEHEDGVRALNQKNIERYKNRIYDKLDDKAKAKIIKTAKNDISNILSAMKPTKNKIILYRNVRIGDAMPRYNVNDIVEIKIISSTFTTPYDASYSKEKPFFYRYEITVPKNGFILELDGFDRFTRNEDGEVLLPPMKCKIKNTRNSDNENYKGIIELEYIEELPANIYTYNL